MEFERAQRFPLISRDKLLERQGKHRARVALASFNDNGKYGHEVLLWDKFCSYFLAESEEREYRQISRPRCHVVFVAAKARKLLHSGRELDGQATALRGCPSLGFA